jgi:uncharacterized protein
MLHRYRFSNLYSFRESTEVDLCLNKRESPSDWWAEEADGQRVGKVMAVIGPNASGKTSLLNALAFLHWFLLRSFSQSKPGEPIPVYAHVLTLASEQPTELEFEFTADFDGSPKYWLYKFKMTHERVLVESLFVKRKRWVTVFSRQWDDKKKSYVIKDNGFGALPLDVVNARQNASLISIGIQYGLPIAKAFSELAFCSNLNEIGKEWSDISLLQDATNFFFEESHYQEGMNRLLKSWDLGLSKVLLREFTVLDAKGDKKPHRIALVEHRGRGKRPFILPLMRESRGTQAAFVLLHRLMPVLAKGGLAVIDEFESDLHPHMLEPILDLFASPQTNPHNAQLIFTCHSMEVLNLLPKSQVTLTEKDEFNESHVWRLDSVEGIRSDDNFYAKYMAGAYGAVPRL